MEKSEKFAPHWHCPNVLSLLGSIQQQEAKKKVKWFKLPQAKKVTHAHTHCRIVTVFEQFAMRDLSFSLHDSRRERASSRRKKNTPRANMLVLLLLTQKPCIQLQLHSPKLAARKSCSYLLLADGRVSIPSLDFTRARRTL